MLAKIRSGSNSLIVRIILGLIALSFVGVGGASFINGNSKGDAVVFNDTESISQEEFQIAKAREVENIQRQNGINLTDEQIAELGIDNNILRRLINDSMIKYLAKIYDFDISDEKIISFVKRTAYFKNQDGEFDPSIFKSAFNNSPRKEEEYLASIKQQLVSSTMVNVFLDSFVPSKIQNDNMIDYMAETRSVDLVSIDLAHVPTGYKVPAISDDQLSEFYQNSKDSFVSPELRSFDYIVADNAYLKKKLEVSKAELKKYFSENTDDFSSDNFEKVEKQVREAFVQEKTEELASELAKNLEEDASSGLKLAEIAKKYGLQVHSQREISLTEMQVSQKMEYVELADTVFELMDGDVSYPIEIKNQNSIMLVELKSTKALRQKELPEVKEEVQKILEQRLLAIENVNALDSLRKTYDSKKNNRAILKDKGISIAVNQPYTRAELPLQDKLPPELLRSIFNIKKGETTQLVNRDKTLYFAHVNTVKKSNKKAKQVRENSAEHFSNVAREGVFLELISYLTFKNKMKVSQES
jgi:peptidyl-prolyl cis-trans isomerase D